MSRLVSLFAGRRDRLAEWALDFEEMASGSWHGNFLIQGAEIESRRFVEHASAFVRSFH